MASAVGMFLRLSPWTIASTDCERTFFLGAITFLQFSIQAGSNKLGKHPRYEFKFIVAAATASTKSAVVRGEISPKSVVVVSEPCLSERSDLRSKPTAPCRQLWGRQRVWLVRGGLLSVGSHCRPIFVKVL